MSIFPSVGKRLLMYTNAMTAYGRFRQTQRVATPENGVASRKQARQALLRRIRKQRAIVVRRLVVKDKR